MEQKRKDTRDSLQSMRQSKRDPVDWPVVDVSGSVRSELTEIQIADAYRKYPTQIYDLYLVVLSQKTHKAQYIRSQLTQSQAHSENDLAEIY